jgi:hypothetical protein
VLVQVPALSMVQFASSSSFLTTLEKYRAAIGDRN